MGKNPISGLRQPPTLRIHKERLGLQVQGIYSIPKYLFTVKSTKYPCIDSS